MGGDYTLRATHWDYDYSSRENDGYPAGDFRYLPSSQLQVQDGPIDWTSEHAIDNPRNRESMDDSSGIPERFRQGCESLSVIRNVTVRDSKRPKARSSDRDYHRRCSTSPATLKTVLGLQTPTHTRTPVRNVGSINAHQPGGSTVQRDEGGVGGYATHASLGVPGNRPWVILSSSRMSDPGSARYEIFLSFEGRTVKHIVSRDMWVRELRDDAARIYHLVSQDLILVLFGMNPRSLVIQNQLSDPPQVGPGATVLIFNILGGGRPDPPLNPPTGQQIMAAPFPSANFPGAKILGNFKLTKFDGSSRNWKQWDKSFVRFLSIHQLDHVIEESFLAVLPLSPQDFNSNKMLYYILEDALVPASLAAKYFRQAAKWNGNEAYARLYDGYVFSGPQTMSLLLAELVNLRFKADESASGFCLRLQEIFEDLEMVPGPSSITMNDTQKIGYLLTGIHCKINNCVRG
jgi:hypothetical protein